MDYDAYRAAGRRTMRSWSASLSGVEDQARITEDDPAHAILTIADQVDPALIVLGAQARGGWPPRLLGSVRSKVLHASICPVAVVPRFGPN